MCSSFRACVGQAPQCTALTHPAQNCTAHSAAGSSLARLLSSSSAGVVPDSSSHGSASASASASAPKPAALRESEQQQQQQADLSAQQHQASSSELHPDPFTQRLQQRTEQSIAGLGRLERETVEGNDKQGTGVSPKSGEVGGPKGPEPTRFGDWEQGGRCTDF